MAQAIPSITKQWNVVGYDGFTSLRLSEQPIPPLGDTQVLVKIKGASLNYRDLLVPRGKCPFSATSSITPGSHGVGTVLAVRKHVTRFLPGGNVVTTLNEKHIAGSVTSQIATCGLGSTVDGTLRQIGVFTLDEVREAYEYLAAGTHQGKVGIEIS